MRSLLFFLLGSASAHLRVLTFDLDDTLFPCGAVVARANAALLDGFVAHGVTLSSAETITERIRMVRSQSPVKLTYSAMRRRAIASILASATDAAEDSEAIVTQSGMLFDVWLAARHQAAEELLYDGAVEAIRECVSAHPNAIVGAVTNGRGDPMYMPMLKSLFHFTVSGEDDEVFPDRKPSPAIYSHALERAASACQAELAADGATEALAASWVHVGDCLVNDVDASKAVGAKTIWLDLDADPGTKMAWLDSGPGSATSAPAYSTASAEEVMLRRQRADAALQGGRVDARITTISQLPGALSELV